MSGAIRAHTGHNGLWWLRLGEDDGGEVESDVYVRVVVGNDLVKAVWGVLPMDKQINEHGNVKHESLRKQYNRVCIWWLNQVSSQIFWPNLQT